MSLLKIHGHTHTDVEEHSLSPTLHVNTSWLGEMLTSLVSWMIWVVSIYWSSWLRICGVWDKQKLEMLQQTVYVEKLNTEVISV